MDNLREILVALGFSPQDNGLEYRCKPIYRDSGNQTSLAIEKATGLWFDFSLGEGGGLPSLVKLALKTDSEETLTNFLEFHHYEAQTFEEERPKLNETKIYPDSCLANLIKEPSYWESRGISRATVSLFEGGVATTGKMMNRYIFPVRNGKKQIIGFIGRDIQKISSKSRPKYKILGKRTEFKWPLLHNNNIIKTQNSVILVESPACVMKLWDCGIKNTICIFGTRCSDAIINFLIRYDIGIIHIATNNEPDNNSIGNQAAEKIKDKLLNFFDSRQIKISLPTLKDFGDMNEQQIKDWQKQYGVT